MASKIQLWDSPDKAKNQLKRRLDNAKELVKRQYTGTWEENEFTVYANNGYPNMPNSLGFTTPGLAEENDPSTEISVNYSFKNLRFIHSQLSANPPSVAIKPTSTDSEDKRKADAADRLVRYLPRQYNLQERFELLTLNCLVYGSAVMKTIWNPEAGEIIDHNRETNEITMEGDIEITVPNMKNIYIDPDAETWDEVRYIFEKRLVPFEEAAYLWPDKVETLKQYRQQADAGESNNNSSGPMKYDVVEVYEYWEKGKPYNAMLGRYCICTSGGEPITEVIPNPFSFSKGDMPPTAHLPYHLMTDIDVPRQVLGKSFLEYEGRLQDVFNRLDRVWLNNIKAHGVARIIVPEGSDVNMDESITNSPWDIIKIKGTQPPFFMEPLPLPPAIPELRNQLKQGIDDMAGVNDSMMGQMSRETSGFSLQYATNNGNMIRRRLFNKYTLVVESVYRGLLNLVKKHWSENRVILVLGKEKAFEAMELKGADIDGGYDLIPEFGQSLSMDPMVRREEIMTMMPLFEKAGVPTRTILSMIKLNELEGLYDEVELANDRQREIFEEMIATDRYIPPRKLQDHANMLAYAMHYVMTTEFKYLDDDKKLLIEQHIEERAQLAAQDMQPGATVPTPGPGMPAAPQAPMPTPAPNQPPG